MLFASQVGEGGEGSSNGQVVLKTIFKDLPPPALTITITITVENPNSEKLGKLRGEKLGFSRFNLGLLCVLRAVSSGDFLRTLQNPKLRGGKLGFSRFNLGLANFFGTLCSQTDVQIFQFRKVV